LIRFRSEVHYLRFVAMQQLRFGVLSGNGS
jgi:hypothetical protein